MSIHDAPDSQLLSHLIESSSYSWDWWQLCSFFHHHEVMFTLLEFIFQLEARWNTQKAIEEWQKVNLHVKLKFSLESYGGLGTREGFVEKVISESDPKRWSSVAWKERRHSHGAKTGQWVWAVGRQEGAPACKGRWGTLRRNFFASHRNFLKSLKTSHWHEMCNQLFSINPSFKDPFLCPFVH